MLLHRQYLHSGSHLYYNHTSDPGCQLWPFWTLRVIPGPKSAAWSSGGKKAPEIPLCMKMSVMWEKARSALWCISLIYYLTDFQALILSTLEEESPFLPPPSCSTCDIMAGLSAFSMGYNIFRASLGGERVWTVVECEMLESCRS